MSGQGGAEGIDGKGYLAWGNDVEQIGHPQTLIRATSSWWKVACVITAAAAGGAMTFFISLSRTAHRSSRRIVPAARLVHINHVH